MEKDKLLSEIAQIDAKMAEGDTALHGAYNALKREKLARIAEIDGVSEPVKKTSTKKTVVAPAVVEEVAQVVADELVDGEANQD